MHINKNSVKNIAMSMTMVCQEKIKKKYFDMNKLFDYFYSQILPHAENFAEDLNDIQNIKNLKMQPDFAFVHYLGNQLYPELYRNTVCEIDIDPEYLKQLDVSVDEYMEKTIGDRYMTDLYSDVVFEIIDHKLDKEISTLINRNEMLKELNQVPISELELASIRWEGVYVDEYGIFANAVFVAFSRYFYNKMLMKTRSELKLVS